jgi:hypothetical protein
MVVNERYEVELKINDTLLDFPPANYIFTIKDSIHSLYPKATLNFNDSSGQFNEFLAFVNGTRVSIKFGNKDDFIICPFVVIKNSIPEQMNQVSFGGTTELELIHEYYIKQQKHAHIYNDEISSIIRKKSKEFPFNTTDLDITQSKGTWYQPLINDSDFMTLLLLPFAYATDSAKSPFYLYIDANNDFYFKSYKKLVVDQKEELELFHKGGIDVDGLAKDRILYINSYQSSTFDLREMHHREVTYLDKSGNLKKEYDSINSYPTASNLPGGKIPIVIDPNLVTGRMRLLDEDISSTSTVNDNNGLQISSMRDGLLPDKIVLSCNLNTNLRAGKKIKVKVYNPSVPDQSEISYRYSGEYLIESSYHKWTGRMASTVLICGRQSIVVPNNYSNSKILLSK